MNSNLDKPSADAPACLTGRAGWKTWIMARSSHLLSRGRGLDKGLRNHDLPKRAARRAIGASGKVRAVASGATSWSLASAGGTSASSELGSRRDCASESAGGTRSETVSGRPYESRAVQAQAGRCRRSSSHPFIARLRAESGTRRWSGLRIIQERKAARPLLPSVEVVLGGAPSSRFPYWRKRFYAMQASGLTCLCPAFPPAGFLWILTLRYKLPCMTHGWVELFRFM